LESANNMKRTKFYVCPCCGSFMQGTGNSQVVCCGKQLEVLKAVSADDGRNIPILTMGPICTTPKLERQGINTTYQG